MNQVKAFFDPKTFTLTYVVWDSQTRDAVILDPVWDYDSASATLSQTSFQLLTQFIQQQDLNIHFVLETHAHADHISSSQLVKKIYPKALVAINERICSVQKVFKELFFLTSLATDGSQFDRLLKDGDCIQAGSLSFKVLFTPGHTPACTSFVFDNMVFTGDALFMPDSGVGRCDFPEGSASLLFDSITQRLFTLPEETVVYTGHDYQPGGRALKFQSTIKEEMEFNIHLNKDTSREGFIKFRTDRDRTLSAPALLLPSIQINIAAGHLPPPRPNGKHYLSLPLTEKTG